MLLQVKDRVFHDKVFIVNGWRKSNGT